MRFANRHDAGRRLGEQLAELAIEDPIVIGMARGGVPVAAEVARALDAPLDVAVVRKIGSPHQPEAAIGAIAENGVAVIDERAVMALGLSDEELGALVSRERTELERRLDAYRDGRPAPEIGDRTAILVDDGLATGMTALAAARSLRERGALRVVLAVPVCAAETKNNLPDGAIDTLVCLYVPEQFLAVGLWYEDFRQVSDEEVIATLSGTSPREPEHAAAASEFEVAADGALLPGTLTLPPRAKGVVVFAHGSGSSRHSPRNVLVAETLQRDGLGTLLFDLLTPAEAEDRSNVFDIPLLAGRLVAAITQLRAVPEVAGLPIGLFGASTGGGAALWAAADPEARVAAVVSRGGRPDLAGPRLADVRAPTLLLVGGRDEQVIELNREAMAQMTCAVELAVIPGATHLFEEPGALEKVSSGASAWFAEHFGAGVDSAVA